MKKVINLLFSIIFSLAIITGAIKFTVGFKQLYYWDINKLNISEYTNMTEDELKRNYDYLIEYNVSRNNLEFELPTLKSSPQGKIHFEEVRDIFQNVNKLFFITCIISLVGIYINKKNNNIEILKSSGIILITMPIVLTIPIALNFQQSFVIFHKLLFENDYWIFDPNLDPVINMLPEQFFFHCGMLILLIILIASGSMLMAYK
ncbi:MAG: TIGR01906 family membrane protein, partial [Paraclostridium sp.]